jgi:hypothetical protein
MNIQSGFHETQEIHTGGGQTALPIPYAGVGVLAGIHSFLVLSVAISLGQIQANPTPRQLGFGTIMATTGVAVAVGHLLCGAHLIREWRFQKGSSESNDQMGIFSPESLFSVILPIFLLLFWLAIGVWIFLAHEL